MNQEEMVRAPAVSFIVRLWNDGGSVPEMRGEVEYVGTGEKRFFLTYWSLLHLLDAWRRDLETAQ
jgi:hypothetical protein